MAVHAEVAGKSMMQKKCLV